LKGRESSTMKSYQSSYRKLVEICRKCGMSVFGLDEEARCEIWLEAREERLSTGSVRGISAVISLLKEVMGEEDACSGRERVLKRALELSEGVQECISDICCGVSWLGVSQGEAGFG
jgi:hypothetical protein